MILDPKTVRRTNRVLLFCSIILEVIFAYVYLISSWLVGKAFPLFDFEQKVTIPSLFASCQLFPIGFTLVIVSLQRRRSLQRQSWRFLFAVGSGFVYAAIDNLFKINRSIYSLLHHFTWVSQFKSDSSFWILLYVLIGIVALLTGYRDLIAFWRVYPKGTFVTVIGISIFVFGVGVELLDYKFIQPEFRGLPERQHSLVLFLSPLKATIAEFLKMLGQTIALYGISLFWVRRLEKVVETQKLLIQPNSSVPNQFVQDP